MKSQAEIEVHPAVRSEMQGAYAWYLERSPDAAEALVVEIDRAIAEISELPEAWPLLLEGSRRFVLRRFPFSVVYRYADGVALVVAFAHHRRRPGYWRGRSQ